MPGVRFTWCSRGWISSISDPELNFEQLMWKVFHNATDAFYMNFQQTHMIPLLVGAFLKGPGANCWDRTALF
jgi:hypothetical protein